MIDLEKLKALVFHKLEAGIVQNAERLEYGLWMGGRLRMVAAFQSAEELREYQEIRRAIPNLLVLLEEARELMQEFAADTFDCGDQDKAQRWLAHFAPADGGKE